MTSPSRPSRPLGFSRCSRVDTAALSVVVATAVAGALLWPSLPADVAIHFSASGTPGNYVPRTAAVLGGPFAMLVTLAVLRGAAALDPPDDERSFAVVVLSTTVLLGLVSLLVLGWNLGYRLPFVAVVGFVNLYVLAVVGYVVYRAATP